MTPKLKALLDKNIIVDQPKYYVRFYVMTSRELTATTKISPLVEAKETLQFFETHGWERLLQTYPSRIAYISKSTRDALELRGVVFDECALETQYHFHFRGFENKHLCFLHNTRDALNGKVIIIQFNNFSETYNPMLKVLENFTNPIELHEYVNTRLPDVR